MGDSQNSELKTTLKKSMDKFDSADDKEGRATSQALYAEALLATEDLDDAQKNADEAAATGGAGRVAALLCSAQVSILKGKPYSALWKAKQAVAEGNAAQKQQGMSVMGQTATVRRARHATHGQSHPSRVQWAAHVCLNANLGSFPFFFHR